MRFESGRPWAREWMELLAATPVLNHPDPSKRQVVRRDTPSVEEADVEGRPRLIMTATYAPFRVWCRSAEVAFGSVSGQNSE
jgi:hypothetical protein